MARIAFSALIYEIVGKLGGSVFQYSYGGWQVHVKNSPRNPQTKYQQLRRGDFGFLAASWRNLSAPQRQTFIDAAVTAPAAFNLFVTTNVNLILINQPPVTNYIPTTAPISMPIDVAELSPGTFKIIASTATTVVPPGSSLLVYATSLKAPTKIFTNPSQYSPIAVFPAGSNISTATSILPEYITRFGQINADLRLCIKSVLIDTTNGSRGAESFNCTTSEEMSKVIPLISFFANEGDSVPAGTNVFNYAMPANTVLNNGDTVAFDYTVKYQAGGAVRTVSFNFAALGLNDFSAATNVTLRCSGYFTRVNATTARFTVRFDSDNSTITEQYFEFSAIDWTVINNIFLVLTGSVANDVIAVSGYLLLIKI